MLAAVLRLRGIVVKQVRVSSLLRWAGIKSDFAIGSAVIATSIVTVLIALQWAE